MSSEPRVSLREEQKSLTRHRLLDAAVTVCTEKSVVDVTMEDIAKAAGVTRVTVYAHFAGKAEILQALVDRVYGAMGEVFAELAALPRWTRPGIRDWLEDATASYRKITPTLRVVRQASYGAVRDTSKSKERYVGAHERYAALLTGDPERWRNIPPAQAGQRALMAVLQTESFLSAWVVVGLPLETEDPLDLLTDTLCHVLGPALENDARRP